MHFAWYKISATKNRTKELVLHSGIEKDIYYREESIYFTLSLQSICNMLQTNKSFHHLYKMFQNCTDALSPNRFISSWKGRDMLVFQALLTSHYYSPISSKIDTGKHAILVKVEGEGCISFKIQNSFIPMFVCFFHKIRASHSCSLQNSGCRLFRSWLNKAYKAYFLLLKCSTIIILVQNSKHTLARNSEVPRYH